MALRKSHREGSPNSRKTPTFYYASTIEKGELGMGNAEKSPFYGESWDLWI